MPNKGTGTRCVTVRVCVSGEHSLQLLRKTLGMQYRDSLPEMLTASEGRLQLGAAVIAKYHLDQGWYRATISQVLTLYT